MGTSYLGDIPGEHVQEQTIESVAAGDATELQTVFVAPFDCKVTGVSIIADAAVTGDDTNTKNLNIQDRGSDGAGTTEITNLDLANGVDLVAHDEKVIGSGLSTSMLVGEALALQIEKVGTGGAIPRSIVRVTFEPAV